MFLQNRNINQGHISELRNICTHILHNFSFLCLRHSNRLGVAAYSHAVDNKFVPSSGEISTQELQRLQDFMNTHRKLFILTGAGISTESGIPDYRSEGVGLYATSTNRPVNYADFLKNASIRQRYWARNFIGWPKFSSAQPNKSHYVLSDWERRGRIHWLVTQNVDALHYKAGSQNVTELHGSAYRVHCLSCSFQVSRHEMQSMIQDVNPGWSAEAVSIGPDGDVDLKSELIHDFKVPKCPSCQGDLKPEIIFFGDNVAKNTLNFVLEKMFHSDAVLVIGSSLEVYSGYRFVNRASSYGLKVAIVNIGSTRGDKHAHVKISGRCGDILQRLTASHQ